MKVLMTIDVEAHRVIDEITGSASDSLGDILSTLQDFGCRATFFVDLCEVPTWGEEFMRGVCRRIIGAGQDIQLHAHPHHLTGDSRWLLSEYTRDEQAQILKYAIERYVEFVGRRPLAFRAGGFGANRDTIELLVEHGVRVDSSFMRGWRGSALDAPVDGVPFFLSGLREIPLTPVTLLGPPGKPLRIAPIDFNWIPLFAMKRVLRSLRGNGAPFATMLLHSSSLCMRLGSRRFSYRRARLLKLKKLLAFLQEEDFRVTSVDRSEEDGLWDCEYQRPVAYEERSLFLQYVNLMFRSFVGMSFKPKFACFVGLHFLVVILVFTAILLLAR
jgi:peptidoglycan/xylan/chitin deacetylase (PgdA/CDA1 family)